MHLIYLQLEVAVQYGKLVALAEVAVAEELEMVEVMVQMEKPVNSQVGQDKAQPLESLVHPQEDFMPEEEAVVILANII